MFVHDLNPVLFSVGPVTVYWYGLVYVLGFVALYVALRRLSALSSEEIDSLLVWLFVGLFLGARSFFFAFYRPDLFSFTQFFMVWEGGMSFHGGVVGLVSALVWWARSKGHDAWALADIGALLAGWVLALGRVANFVNAEIVGRAFSGSWCVVFPGEDVCRHPVQLYAALKDVFLGSVLAVLYTRRSFSAGFLFWVFVCLYGLLRFFVQFWRDEVVVILGLQAGHLLSAVFVVVAATVLVRSYLEDLKKVFKRA